MTANAQPHIHDILWQRSAANPSFPALIVPGQPPVTYRDLCHHVGKFSAALRQRGINRGDCVAVVLPDGPEFASAILAVTSVAICAPLDSELQHSEFEFLLTDMKAKAIVLAAGSSGTAFETAREIGLEIFTAEPLDQGDAGLPSAHADPETPEQQADFREATNTAILLYTSGTTASPKCIALSHRNLCLSAECMANSLSLGPDDRCFGIVPLFHVHGLVGTLLAPLVSGGATILPGRFHAARFFEHMAKTKPTWFTGTPAILHQIADRADDNREAISDTRLRFIRSASAPLPSSLLESLERQFSIPVIEAYGMTEASHQIASNPLPPDRRKPGSVGLPSGPQVAIHSADGKQLKTGKSGEIVIRGATVITHYLGEPTVNSEAFRDRWLRTGDQGFIDEDGYLFIDGRLKEIINRGGEKISPVEVETVLNRHPAVVESGVFPVPDARLGEDIAACVVINDDSDVSVRSLQDFASRRLANFKIPRQIFFADMLPKSATGKLQRNALRALWSEQVGDAGSSFAPAGYVAPGSKTEKILAAIWEEVLNVDEIGAEDNFFDLGGDSLQAVMVLARIEDKLEVDLPVAAFFDRPTIAKLGQEIDAAATAGCRATPVGRTSFSGDLRPLSFTQQLIVSVLQDPLVARSTTFNRIAALRISGPLDKSHLRQAIDKIVKRHEVLRTNLVFRDESALARVRSHSPVQVPEIDFGGLDPARQEARLRTTAIEFGNRHYDLQSDHLIRFCLVRLSDIAHMLLVCSHYFVFDGWSMRLFIQELVEHYGAAIVNTVPDIESLPIQYSDYAHWQTDRLNAGALDEHMAFWRRLLAEEPPHVKFDRNKWTNDDNLFELEKHVLMLDANITQSLRDIALRHHATLNMVLLTALNILFSRLEGHRDLLFLTQSAGRSQRETECLIGNFVNTIPIRSRIEPDQTFLQQLAVVRRLCLEAMDNENVPFGTLIKEIFPDRNLLLDPVSPLLFVFKNFSMSKANAGDTTFAPYELDYQTELFGLIVKVHEGKSDLPCNFLYNRLVVTDIQAKRLATCYRLVLDQIAADPNARIDRFLTAGPLIKNLGLRAVLAEALRSLVAKLPSLRGAKK